jgi:hypothetical protein
MVVSFAGDGDKLVGLGTGFTVNGRTSAGAIVAIDD